jgi:ADP-ribose pyrophosphatase YjhB (NUDIX family)
MSDREPLTFRAMEAVEALLRRRVSVDMLRRAYRVGYLVLRPWWFLTRPTTMGVKAVVRCGDEVLLVRHTYARRRLWDAPGGFLRPGEDPERAAMRELAEELGVRPTAMMMISRAPSNADHKRETLIAYAADVPDRHVTPSPAEIGEARWFHHAALPPASTRIARRLVARAYWELWQDEAERPRA